MRPVPASRTTSLEEAIGCSTDPTRPGHRPRTPPATPPFALHLLHGWWIASCPECGHELGRSRDQEAAERAGERRRCPICRSERPDRSAGLAFLVAWLTANGLDEEEAS